VLKYFCIQEVLAFFYLVERPPGFFQQLITSLYNIL